MVRTRREREQVVATLSSELQQRLIDAGIPAEVYGRPKHFHSIYRKMMRDELNFEQVFDLIALRVMVYTVPECYASLGIVHDTWVPLPEMVTDYIARPKPNGYQSLHTKVVGPEGTPLEVQIRTWEMHHALQCGIAAHWAYKEDATPHPTSIAAYRGWGNDRAPGRYGFEFMTGSSRPVPGAGLCDDPQGRPVRARRELHTGGLHARIHTQLGHECVGAKVNGRQVPLSHALPEGRHL